MTVNSEILDLANDIKAIKETVRQAIENKGVSCSTSVAFDKYPNKISQIGQDIIWARNDLDTEPQTDDKVWIAPVNYNQDEYYKFYSTSQFDQFHMLYLVPLKGYECVFQCRSTYDTTYGYNCLWSLDPTTGVMTSVGLSDYNSDTSCQENCTDTNHSTNTFGANVWMYTPYIVVSNTKYTTSYTSYGYQYTRHFVQNINSMTTSISKTRYEIPNQWTIQGDNLYKVNDLGEISSESYGTFATPPSDHMYAGDGFIVTTDGRYVVETNVNAGQGDYTLYYFRHSYNSSTEQFDRSTHSISGLPTRGYNYQCIGVTSDSKYAFFQHCNIETGRSYGYSPFIVNVSSNGYLSLATDLNINLTNACLTFYPDEQLLFVSHNDNTLSMYKYDETLGFVEQYVDLGEIVPRSSQRIGKNYDGTLISLQDSDNILHVLQLDEVSTHTYKAMPFTYKNFLSTSFTGILTGNKNTVNNTVEVLTALPPEYQGEVTVELTENNAEITVDQ